jgi:FkbM family methyltransferase
MKTLNNFTVIDSVYGAFVVNRHCAYQAEHLIKTGRPHIDEEVQKILLIVASLPDGAVFVDAGANIGLVSLPVAQALAPRGGTVLAFEAQRLMAYALGGAAALNDLINLHVFHKGLGAQAQVQMTGMLDYGAPQDFGTYSLLEQGGERRERLEIVTVDSLGLPRLDFLKIDVEGMEVDVIKGAEAAIARHRPWLWVEHWIIGADRIKAAMPHPDYRFLIADGMNMICAPREKLEASGIRFDLPEA